MLQIPVLLVLLDQFSSEKGMISNYSKKQSIFFLLTKNIWSTLQLKILSDCCLSNFFEQFRSCTGYVVPSYQLEDISRIALTLSPCWYDENSEVFVPALNLSDNQITLNIQTEIPRFEYLKKGQAEDIIQIDFQLISKWKMGNSDKFDREMNQLMQKFQFEKKLTQQHVAHLRITRNSGFQLRKRAPIFQTDAAARKN